MRRLVLSIFLLLLVASPVLAQTAQPGDPTIAGPTTTSTPQPASPGMADLTGTPAPQPGSPDITTPRPGEVLQGAIAVNGTCGGPGFEAAELSFSYSDDPTGTWFWIATLNQPVDNQLLATWDTSSITDGNYSLRLQLYLSDGSILTSIVPSLRVRNYTSIETPTPTPTVPQATPLPTNTDTSTPFPTPSALPQNQAVLSTTVVASSILYGGLAACLLFILVGLYLWLRRNL